MFSLMEELTDLIGYKKRKPTLHSLNQYIYINFHICFILMHYLTPSGTHKGKDAGDMQYERFYPHFILPILRLIPETLK